MANTANRISGFIALMIALVVISSVSSAHAGSRMPTAYQVKAAYLYNFIKFINLPENAFSSDDEPISICILGDKPFGDAIDEIAGKTAKNRKITVRYVSGTERIRDCHVLFICESEKARLREILKNNDRTGLLTVSDIKGFTEAGGMIGLVTVDNKVRFKINLAVAQKAGLKISSQLLKLAVEVDGGER